MSIGEGFETVEDRVDSVMDCFDCVAIDTIVILEVAKCLVTLDPEVAQERQHLIASDW